MLPTTDMAEPLSRSALRGLIPIDEWRRLQAAARPSLKQLLLTDSARTDMLVPERGKARRRQAVALR